VLPLVVIVSTGGTIAARAADAGATIGYAIDPAGPDLAPELVMPLGGVARVVFDAFCRVPSTDMGRSELMELARCVSRHLAEPGTAGVVVTHGTDTLEETALFLDLTLPGSKPVVLTGAMRPGGAIGADGARNLLNAVRIAVDPEATARGVLVSMDDRIIAASGATKRHATALNAFQPPEHGLLGGIVADRVSFHQRAAPAAASRLYFDVTAQHELPAVDILYLHQDAGSHLFDAVIAGGAAGLVLACTGNGSLSRGARAGVERAIAAGLVVVRASRVGAGTVTWPSLPGIPAGKLNPQQARIVLMLALSRTQSAELIAGMFSAL
jgi:L-asparaginase